MLQQPSDEVLGPLRHRGGELEVHLQVKKGDRFHLCHPDYIFLDSSGGVIGNGRLLGKGLSEYAYR